MDIRTIDAGALANKLAEGAVLVDIRSRSEYLREHIDGAHSLPLAQIRAQGLESIETDAELVFCCLSGMRTAQNRTLLAQEAHGRTVFLLEGGLQAWKKSGRATVADQRQPLDLMRQVQIGAGALVLAGALGGWLVSSWFYLLCGAVGAGLLAAGLTGFCGMARLLVKMPWNRALRQEKTAEARGGCDKIRPSPNQREPS